MPMTDGGNTGYVAVQSSSIRPGIRRRENFADLQKDPAMRAIFDRANGTTAPSAVPIAATRQQIAGVLQKQP